CRYVRERLLPPMFFVLLRAPTSTLFPYTTLFRSVLASIRVRVPAALPVGWFASRTGTHVCKLLIKQYMHLRDLADVEFAFSQFADRKSTRLNSSHVKISYAVFCLKKKIDTDDWRT